MVAKYSHRSTSVDASLFLEEIFKKILKEVLNEVLNEVLVIQLVRADLRTSV